MKVYRFIFVLFLIAFEVRADQSTLIEVYRSATSYDATLNSAKQENAAQQEEISKSLSAFLPQARLSIYEGRGQTDSEQPGVFGQTLKLNRSYDSKNYSFSVRQPLLNFANIADYSQSKAEVAKSNSLLNKEEKSLMGRVGGAYLEVILAAENIIHNYAQRESLESQLVQAEKRLKAGIGTITEISEAKANLQSVIAQGFEFLNNFEYNKRLLENISGIYLNDFYILDPKKLIITPPQPENIDEWVDIAMKKNPDILAAVHDIDAMNEEVNKNLSGHFPTLDLVAARTKTESDNNFTIGSKFDTDTIGLQLNIPIFSGGYTASSVRQAQARLRNSEEKLLEKQRTVINDVRKYYNELISGISRIYAKEMAVKANEDALFGTQKGYDSGLRSNVEVLNAQEKLYSAKRELAQERYKLIYNRLMLKISSGIIDESDLKEVNEQLSMKYSDVMKNN